MSAASREDRTRPGIRAVPIHGPGDHIIGSGVAVGPGLVLTALHVVDSIPCASLRAGTLSVRGVAALPARCFGALRAAAWVSYRRSRALTDHDHGTVDLALLAVPGLPARPLVIRQKPVSAGERITVVGYASGRLTVTAGPVTSLDDADFVAHLVLGPGASGSPAIDGEGRLAGLATLDHDDSGSIFIGPALLAEFVRRTRPLFGHLPLAGPP